jgi:hypothetical protein
MKTKTLAISTGVLLVVLAFLTIFRNPLIGYYGYFRTDLAFNMIHFLTGLALALVAIEWIGRMNATLRALGIFYVVLAVLGALTTGFDAYGTMFGFMAVSGPLHILHLAIGLMMLVFGTRDMRMDAAL